MKKQVWIVEDDPNIGDIISMVLIEDGYEVSLFSDAGSFKAALKHQTSTADLFVMDVMLPDGNGVELCEATKSDQYFSAIPVLMMSAHAGFAAIKLSCSADDFIPKPFDIDDLSARVNRLLVRA